MITHPRIRRVSAGIAVALVGALATLPAALAGGEPKNQAPFTRLATARVLTEQIVGSHSAAGSSLRGEPKNESPFTRR